MMFRTTLCDLLKIEYPIVQPAMPGASGPELVIEVSKAGGLGVLPGLFKTADQLRADIGRVRAATDRPFGINLWLHEGLRPPIPGDAISQETLHAVQRALNAFRRRLGLPDRIERPAPPPDLVDEAFQVVLDERVPVFSTIFGPPDRQMIDECHRRGVLVMAMVTTPDDARTVVANGADTVIAQGGEAGGHRGTFRKAPAPEVGAIGTVALVPQVVDAVRVPVIAAGGLCDGRGLVAALALGASGIVMGTRLVATRESTASEAYKKTLVERGGDVTTVTDVFTGLYARAMRNAYSEEYRQSGAPVLPAPWQRFAAGDIYEAAQREGNADYFPMWSGQGVGLIHNLPGAAEVIEATIREARALLLERLPRAVKLSG